MSKQFDQDQQNINKEATEQEIRDVLAGRSSNEELASEDSTWETEQARIPEEDMKKCGRIVQELQDRMAKRLTNYPMKGWVELQRRAQEKFHEIGLKAHVEIEIHALNRMTGLREVLKIATSENQRLGCYKIEDGEILIPNMYRPMMLVPNIVIEDWENLDLKKDKAEQQIITNERRRNRGDRYHPSIKDAMNG